MIVGAGRALELIDTEGARERVGLRKSTEQRTERTCCSVSPLSMAMSRMERVPVKPTQAARKAAAGSFMEGCTK